LQVSFFPRTSRRNHTVDFDNRHSPRVAHAPGAGLGRQLRGSGLVTADKPDAKLDAYARNAASFKSQVKLPISPKGIRAAKASLAGDSEQKQATILLSEN
jgi:hypothetical protein